MNGFHDFLIDSDIEDLAGWSREAAELDTVLLEASEWGEIKRKIAEEREDADILVLRGDKEFNSRACEDSRLDMVLVQGNSRIAQSTAEAASKHGIVVAFDFSSLRENRLEEMKKWKTDISILNKHGADYTVTTGADAEEDVRDPRDISALIDELGGDGAKAVKRVPSRLMKKVKSRKSGGFVNKGVDEV